MKKTHEPPKEFGYYWAQLRDDPDPEWIVVRVIVASKEGGSFLIPGSHLVHDFEKVRWWWEQPVIKPPA
jgi:hypothetical protein